MGLRLRVVLPFVVVAGFAGPRPAQAQCVHRAAAETYESGDAGRVIGSLRQISKELIEAVSLLHRHLDDAIARFDRGYRTSDGKHVQGADADLATGSDDIVTAERVFMIARMLAAKGPDYAPAPLTDSNHIQNLVCEAEEHIDGSEALIRQLLVVSVDKLSSKTQVELKAQHDQLLKARNTAEEAVKAALVSLPIDLSEFDPEQTKKDGAWELLTLGSPEPPEPDKLDKEIRYDSSREAPPKSAPLIPVRLERQKRITLIRQQGYRMALTDSGTADGEGRHIFRQEKWVQRGNAVVRMRWRVGVDAKTGQHILIKRYPQREYRGELDELYKSGRDYLWYLEPPEESAEPSRQEIEAALQEVAKSREEIGAAVDDFRIAIRGALNRNESELDAGLPDELREKLFAIRGHVAGTASVLMPEERVWHALQKAAERIGMLEPLAAWANRVTSDTSLFTTLSESAWGRLQERSDDEIDLTQAARREARALLPPDSPAGTANFPALYNNTVARILRRRSRDEPGGAIGVLQDLILQDLWSLEPGRQGAARRVRRTAALISIDLETGRQTVVGSNAKYYAAAPDDTVEEVFGRYAAQELPIQALRP